jgi:hypothetical protein
MAEVLDRQLAAKMIEKAYREDPATYVKHRLGVNWWSKQIEAARAVVEKRRVFVQASHSIGKSNMCGGLSNWHFDMHCPGITITTAPTQLQVNDVLWKEIRTQRGSRIQHLKPSSPRMQTAPDHFAVGMVAKTGDAFQGRHAENMLFVFDEAVGINGQMYEACEGMMVGPGRRWIAICNPTSTNSRAYQEVTRGDGAWHVIIISAFEHPNILAQMKGEPAPYPKAVQIVWVDEMVRSQCEEIDPRDKRSRDFWWALPDLMTGKRDLDNPQLWRPNGYFESRVLGWWPSVSAGSVWSDAQWLYATRNESSGIGIIQDGDVMDLPAEIGCDVASTGTDYTTIIGRRGGVVYYYKTGNGWTPKRIAGELKEAASWMAGHRMAYFGGQGNVIGEDPKQILIKCDHDATGNAVRENMEGWNFVTQSGASTPFDKTLYPNRRCESWFTLAEMADKGLIDLSRLGEDVRNRMRAQAMGPQWELNGNGQRQLEEKKKTRARLRRSPDDMDALALAFAPAASVVIRAPVLLGPDGRPISIDGSMLHGSRRLSGSPMTGGTGHQQLYVPGQRLM